jgi:hypothetical protein
VYSTGTPEWKTDEEPHAVDNIILVLQKIAEVLACRQEEKWLSRTRTRSASRRPSSMTGRSGGEKYKK